MGATEIASVFKNKILPQLTDYFFEDWEKVRMVLGDDQVSDTSMQFVVEERLPSGLFKAGSLSSEDSIFAINDEALKNPEAYIKIYKNSNGDVE
jgi:hypothetical protein